MPLLHSLGMEKVEAKRGGGIFKTFKKKRVGVNLVGSSHLGDASPALLWYGNLLWCTFDSSHLGGGLGAELGAGHVLEARLVPDRIGQNVPAPPPKKRKKKKRGVYFKKAGLKNVSIFWLG